MNRELDDAIESLDGFRENISCSFQNSNSCQAVYIIASKASSGLNVGQQITHPKRSNLEIFYVYRSVRLDIFL
jgi:hypothetical protein